MFHLMSQEQLRMLAHQVNLMADKKASMHTGGQASGPVTINSGAGYG